MRVIAIDPGYDRLGIAILEYRSGTEHLIHSDCVTTDRQHTIEERLLHLGTAVETILDTYTPTALAIETLFFNKNQKTAIQVAQARGLILYLAKTKGCVIYEFGPQEIKIAVTGYGKSDKSAVIDMVTRLLPSAPRNAMDDEYDAIAVGITCLAHHGRTQ
jgi:crossover junction endodeoxyribonuclease RuvC